MSSIDCVGPKLVCMPPLTATADLEVLGAMAPETCFQVLYEHRTGWPYFVTGLQANSDTAAVFDALRVKEALDAGEDLESLPLSGNGTNIDPQALRRSRAAQLIPFARLVQQLQWCVDVHRGQAGPVGWQPTLLHAAVSGGHLAAVQLLGAVDPGRAQQGDAYQRVPLLLAVDRRHEEAARLLLLLSPDTAIVPDVARDSALLVAQRMGWRGLLQRLAEEQGSQWQHTLGRWLRQLTQAGDERQVAAALWAAAATGVAVESADACRGLLHTAVHCGHFGVARLLLEAAPSLALSTADGGRTPLHGLLAMPGYNWEAWQLIPLLAAVPGAAMARDDDGRLPLHLACLNDHYNGDMVAALVAAAPEALAVQDRVSGASPLLIAMQTVGDIIKEALLRAPPAHVVRALHGADASGRSPWALAVQDGCLLHAAAMLAAVLECEGSEAAMELLAGSNVASVEDDGGRKLVHYAAMQRSPGLLQLLLDAQLAQATEVDAWFHTPLHHAACHNSAAAVAVLLAAAPQLAGEIDLEEATPLALAAHYGSQDSLEALLAAAPGHASAPRDEHGRLPIHHAALRGHDAAVAVLVAAAPDTLSVADADGQTPLLAALTNLHEACSRSLLAASSTAAALAALASLPAGHQMRRLLLADAVAARLPLSPDAWELLPFECEGLGGALPAALAHPAEQVQQLVQRLPAEDAARLRCAALALVRTQRRLRVALPGQLSARILSLSLCD